MKPILKVFLIIGAVLVAVIFWDLVFNSGGILETAYNAVISPINKVFQSVTNSTNNLIPEWGVGETGAGQKADW